MDIKVKKHYEESIKKIIESHCSCCYCGEMDCDDCILSPATTKTKLASNDGLCIARYEMIKEIFR